MGATNLTWARQPGKMADAYNPILNAVCPHEDSAKQIRFLIL
jgi:hypothetical protein